MVDDLGKYLPEGTDEIVSGGARGIDSCAASYARANEIKLTEFLPDYDSFGKSAPILRNKQIVEYADEVIAFWDGISRGTAFVIKYAKQMGKPIRIFKKTV